MIEELPLEMHYACNIYTNIYTEDAKGLYEYFSAIALVKITKDKG